MLLVVAVTGGSHALHVTSPGLSGLQQGVPESLPRAILGRDGDPPLRLAGGAGDKAAVKTCDVGHRGKLSYAWDALGFFNHLLIGMAPLCTSAVRFVRVIMPSFSGTIMSPFNGSLMGVHK